MSASPSRSALHEAGELLRSLSLLRQAYALYPPEHPRRAEGRRRVLDRVRALRAQLGADPVLFVARHAFYLGRVLLPRDTLSRYALLEACERAGVESVRFLPTVGEEDLDRLIRVLARELPPTTPLDGVVLNRAPAPVEDPEDSELTGLRQTYASGLEVLRRLGAVAAAGGRVDLGPVTAVVAEMVRKVGQDPSRALLLSAVRSHDEYTYYHMLNVCLLSVALGWAVGLSKEQVVALGVGAVLHDVGKVHVPVEVLQHVGTLSEEQWRLIQRHPVEGAGILLSSGDSLLEPAVAVVLEHHAAYDLSGYPLLSGRSHPSLAARMVAVADCFDAVTTTRPYRRAEERRQALNILLAGAGRGYDPRVVRAFVRLLGLFPVGSLVRLSDGSVGLVVANHERFPARPRVRVLLDPRGHPCPPREVDLTRDCGPRLAVERTVDPLDVGLDLTSLVLAGRVDEPEGEDEGALVHEPAPGESAPPGYVDAPRDLRFPALALH